MYNHLFRDLILIKLHFSNLQRKKKYYDEVATPPTFLGEYLKKKTTHRIKIEIEVSVLTASIVDSLLL